MPIPSALRSLHKSNPTEVGIAQTVFPSTFFMHITGALSASTPHKNFDWAGPAWMAAHLVLTNQGALAKCVSQCLKTTPPTALCVVFTSPLYHSIFQRLVHNRECVIPTQCHVLWPKCLWSGFGVYCLIQFSLKYHVALTLAFQGPG